MKVILYSPDIPQNVGNIARTCAVTGVPLTLVRPLGFSILEKQAKRAGLDYWEQVQVGIVDSLEDALDGPFYFFQPKENNPTARFSLKKMPV
jgi:tRNA (cytidine/uridine-2'-O-)-methyltransferase